MKNDIDCPHFDHCCMGIVPPAILERAKSYFADTWKIELGYRQGTIAGYRTRAKLAVRAPGKIGLFERGSHTVAEIPQCALHHPKINEAVKRIKQCNFSAYDEKSHSGDLRYIQCVVERSTGRVQLTLVLNRKSPLEGLEKLDDPTFWHSVWCNYNDKPTNTIFGPKWHKISGADVLWEDIAGVQVAFGPSHFGQANLEMYEALILDLKSQILPNSRVTELFAGIGTIGIAIVPLSKRVELVELEPSAKEYFTLAKEKLPKTIQDKLVYTTTRAAHCDDAEVCIVDPPRKGLGADLIKKICNTPTLTQLAYISCDWNSLERDLGFLTGWRADYAQSYLFFPGTDQIETLVILTKC